MKIRRKDCEDREDTDELLSTAITEDVIRLLEMWQKQELEFNLRADIYNVVRQRFKDGIEI